jgi:predicted butyrate kinase (DUF1464 family)
MAISIGIDYTPGRWHICSVEQSKQAEFQFCATAGEMLALVSQVCALYPEPTIVISLDVATPFTSLPALTEQQVDRLAQRYHPTPACTELKEAQLALRSLSLRTYCAPSVEYLPTLPAYRRLLRPTLGNANEVCAIVALLHHMREQEASWPEMNFFYVNAGESGTCVLVIKDGQIVNGIGLVQGSPLPAVYHYLATLESTEDAEEESRRAAFRQAQEEAFWEGLRQDLAGLLAVHQIEDVVLLGQKSPALIERLADLYQVYLFPHAGPNGQGYEAALGAALLAEGLEGDGCAAEVVEHLRISQAGQSVSALPPFSVS